jgi:hypothetical protein
MLQPQPLSPQLPPHAMIKGLLVTFMATRFGWSPEDSEALQNWLICVEMLFAAIGMFFAFPHEVGWGVGAQAAVPILFWFVQHVVVFISIALWRFVAHDVALSQQMQGS